MDIANQLTIEDFVDEAHNPFLTTEEPAMDIWDLPNGFPLSGLLLTYSNINQQLSRQVPGGGTMHFESIKEHLGIFLKDSNPTPCEVMVAEEHHRDGSLHYHCWINYPPSDRRVDSRHWDFEGIHPNIQVVRKEYALKKYIQKEDRDPWRWVLFIDLTLNDEGYLSPESEEE